jgi:polyhydroxyalkanoate synthesis regulator phasin
MSGKDMVLTSDEQESLRNVDPRSHEATNIVETAKLRESSKERSTDNAMYNVLAEVDEVEFQGTKENVLKDLLSKTTMSEEEKLSFVSKFFGQAAEAKEKLDSKREYNQAVLAAKIAARRRMKESLAKEKAMKDEVAALSKKQVGLTIDSPVEFEY